MAGVKRKASHRSAANPIVGPSIEELPLGDLPTLRNVLAKAIWLKESTTQTSNNFTNQMLGEEMVPIILQSYKRVNPLLALYQYKSVYNKFMKEWNEFKNLRRTSSKRGKKRILFDSRLDKLFDIIKCKCDIQKCFDAGCDGCEFEAHVVNCKCSRDTKVRNNAILLIPVKFIRFVLLQ